MQGVLEEDGGRIRFMTLSLRDLIGDGVSPHFLGHTAMGLSKAVPDLRFWTIPYGKL